MKKKTLGGELNRIFSSALGKEDEIIYEYRGKDYPCFGGKNGIKMHKAMSKKERREWFSDEEIKKWKEKNPEGEFQGSF